MSTHTLRNAGPAGIAWLLLWISCSLSYSQGFPEKPIRLVMPFPPGGASEGVARPITQNAASATKKISQKFMEAMEKRKSQGGWGAPGSGPGRVAGPCGRAI